jgi:hypothetical protein
MPAINFAKYNSTIAQEFIANGATISVRLRDGTTFSIKGFEKRQAVEELTDGLVQQGYFVRVIASQWDNLAGRSPDKGDQLTLYKRRHAIESWQRRGIADMYILRLRG